MSDIEAVRRSVTRLFKAVWEKLVDLELRLAQLEERQESLPLGYSRLRLSELIIAHFDVNEIDGLAFSLDLDSDHLSGVTREERTRSLVTLCERRGNMHELLHQCKRQRPRITWPSVPFED